MDSSAQLWQFVRSLLPQLPSMLTLAACMIFCLVRARRHPRVALIAAFSLFYLPLPGILFAAVYVWVPNWFGVYGQFSTSQTFMMVLRLIYNTSLALGLGLLLAAIFTRRGPLTGRT